MTEKGSFHDRQEAWTKQVTRLNQHEGPKGVPEVIHFFQLGLTSSLYPCSQAIKGLIHSADGSLRLWWQIPQRCGFSIFLASFDSFKVTNCVWLVWAIFPVHISVGTEVWLVILYNSYCAWPCSFFHNHLNSFCPHVLSLSTLDWVIVDHLSSLFTDTYLLCHSSRAFRRVRECVTYRILWKPWNVASGTGWLKSLLLSFIFLDPWA